MLTYIEASQNSMTCAIWDKFFLRYWAVFPWRLPLGQDPDPDDPTNYAAKPVDEAEVDAKSKLIEKMEDKIKGWLGQRKGGHPDYKDQISAIFEERKVAVTDKKKSISAYRWRLLARCLLRSPKRCTREWKRGATAEHAALLAKHKNTLEGLPVLDEAGTEEVCLRFANVVGPLLDNLAAHTGYKISILVGRVKKEDGKVDIESASVHAGVTVATVPNLDFSRANPNHELVDEFCEGRVKVTEIPPLVPTRLPNPLGQVLSPIPPIPPPTANPMAQTHTLQQTPTTDTLGGVHLGYKGGLPARLEEFDFPDHLLPGPVAGVLVLDGSAPRINPYGLDFTVPLNADLLMELEALQAGDQEVRLDMLQKMDTKALMGENNRARNHYMLDGMGLGDAEKETLWGGTEAPLTKHKAKKQNGKKPSKRARKTRDPVEEARDEEEEEESGSDVPEEVAVKAKAKALAKGKQVAGRRLGGHSQRNKPIPPLKTERGEGLGFQSKKPYTHDSGPRHIWWVWWLDINLPWRGTKRPLLREAGMWRDAMPKASPDWEEVIDDITWVLIEMQKESNDKPMSSSTPLVASHACGGPVPEGPENMQGTDAPAQGAPSQFSQEELDEINADPEADME
ncbi:hypothetical protein B0H14DRAFT_2601325 [Mycena olivaceomarginata]|nr:hypothetical protein B0H14DRAFT_2601325 [Mycena olivaceomarginata]